jgi:hypothetical protein
MRKILEAELGRAELIVISKATKAARNKVVWHTSCINNVTPKDLPVYMESNNIPETATFEVDCAGGFEELINLSWSTVEALSDEEYKLKYNSTLRTMFVATGFMYVAIGLQRAGYKRTSCSLESVKRFKDICLYDLYINKEYDELVTYFSLYFKLKTEV